VPGVAGTFEPSGRFCPVTVKTGLRGPRRQGAEPAALTSRQSAGAAATPRRRDGVRRLPHERRFTRDLADTLAGCGNRPPAPRPRQADLRCRRNTRGKIW